MNITKAKYYKSPMGESNAVIEATIDEKTVWVPICLGNIHYDAIQEWVAEGNTIENSS